jgi:hypothetical protein
LILKNFFSGFHPFLSKISSTTKKNGAKNCEKNLIMDFREKNYKKIAPK